MVLAAALIGQERPPIPQHGEVQSDQDIKLPSGKSQRDEILTVEHEKTVRDVARLVKLSEQLKADMEKNDWRVLSVGMVKQAEEIEKLARQIKTRLRR